MEKKLTGEGTEQYLKPEMEVVELEKNDVIVTSCTPYRDENEPDW